MSRDVLALALPGYTRTGFLSQFRKRKVSKIAPFHHKNGVKFILNRQRKNEKNIYCISKLHTGTNRFS